MGAKKIVKDKDIIDIWSSMNWDNFYPSSKVDLALFITGEKPAARLMVINEAGISASASTLNHFFTLYTEGTLYASWRDNCEILSASDFSIDSHTKRFGLLLGYPECCAEAMEILGESSIDAYEEAFLQSTSLEESVSPIATKFYREGFSLISHIPCCFSCSNSLRQANKFARKVYALILKYPDTSFGHWGSLLFSKMRIVL